MVKATEDEIRQVCEMQLRRCTNKEIAEALGWRLSNGKPYTSKVQRVIGQQRNWRQVTASQESIRAVQRQLVEVGRRLAAVNQLLRQLGINVD